MHENQKFFGPNSHLVYLQYKYINYTVSLPYIDYFKIFSEMSRIDKNISKTLTDKKDT